MSKQSTAWRAAALSAHLIFCETTRQSSAPVGAFLERNCRALRRGPVGNVVGMNRTSFCVETKLQGLKNRSVQMRKMMRRSLLQGSSSQHTTFSEGNMQSRNSYKTSSRMLYLHSCPSAFYLVNNIASTVTFNSAYQKLPQERDNKKHGDSAATVLMSRNLRETSRQLIATVPVLLGRGFELSVA